MNVSRNRNVRRRLGIGVLALLLAACGAEPSADQNRPTAKTDTQAAVSAVSAAQSTADKPPVAAVAVKPAASATALAAAAVESEHVTPPETAKLGARQAARKQWRDSLSEAQRSSMRDLRQRSRAQQAALRESQREQETEFQQALRDGDRAAAIAASNRLAQLAADAETARLQEQIELSGLLTPEQREAMPNRLRNGLMRGGDDGKHNRRGKDDESDD